MVIAVLNFRRSRQAPYFRLRRSANQIAWRAVLGAVVGMAGILAALRLRQFVPPVDLASLGARFDAAGNEEPPPLVPEQTDMPIPTGETTAGPPTITPTQPTEAPTTTPVIATIDSQVTPPTNASLMITAVSSGISANLQPVDAGTTFPVGVPRIYYWVEFENMQNGISWSRVLLLNGTVVRTESEAWQQGTEGIAYYWFDAQGGWPLGQYEIRFYLGDQLRASETYEVVN
jgi:hypothetical protein